MTEPSILLGNWITVGYKDPSKQPRIMSGEVVEIKGEPSFIMIEWFDNEGHMYRRVWFALDEVVVLSQTTRVK